MDLFSGLPLEGMFYLVLAVMTYYASVFLYAIRWKLVLREMGKDVPLSTLIKAILSSIFVNNVTPTARGGGELLRIFWVSKKHGVPVVLSAASVMYERIVEAFPVVLLILLSVFFFVAYPALPTLVITALLFLLWMKWDDLVDAASKIGKLKVSEEEVELLKRIKRNRFLNAAVFLLSSAVWILDVVRLKLVTMAVGMNLPIWMILLLSLANFALGVVAFTPGGIGIVEGGLIGTLLLLGIPHTLAVAVTLLERFVSYVLSSVVGFLTLVVSGGREVWKALRSH